ncbi:hypothetical protein HY988_05960 [Candidatus Micrarchaeota archaeon]|nr:hypothetical protein [Candidatus Micrarchaeota archaeon]
MGIEKLKFSLLAEGKQEAEAIIHEAERHANEMQKEEEQKHAAAVVELEKEIEKTLQERRNEKVAWARLEAKRITAEAKEDAVANAIEEFFSALEKMRKGNEYKKFMKNAAERIGSELEGNLVLHVVKGEKGLLPKVKNAEIKEDLEGLGGILAESSDGKRRLNLTIETLFEAKRDDIRRRIYDKMFGGK